MPRLDGTGPTGQGPKTGRGLGNCKNDNAKNDNATISQRPLFRRARRRANDRINRNIDR